MNTEFAIKLIEIAPKKDADKAEVYVKTSKSFSIDVKEQKIDTLESSMTMGYSIRVIKNNRLGFSYSTDPDEIDTVVENAMEATRHSEADDYLELPPPTITTREVKIFDSAIAALSEDEAIDRTLLIERSAFSEDSRIKRAERH